MNLLGDSQQLAKSQVVANSMMNRERGLLGINSYQRELRFDIVEFLISQVQNHQNVTWLDLCCGKGKALLQAAEILLPYSTNKVHLLGLDLVDDFYKIPAQINYASFINGVLPNDLPEIECDLVTCVHGLHYVGDKLGLIAQIPNILKKSGIFIANLDHKNIKGPSAKTLRGVCRWLNTLPLSYSANMHIISIKGNRKISSPWLFIGSNDQAGANYTFQLAVDSHYKLV